MTHSLLVMLTVLVCDIDAGVMTADPVLLCIAVEGLTEGGLWDVLGRMAIWGTDDDEEVGVGTFDGEAAEAGLDAELGDSWLTAVVTDSAFNGLASALPVLIPEPMEAVAMAAMLLISLSFKVLATEDACCKVFF